MSNNIFKDAWDKLYQEKYLPQIEALNAIKKKLNMLAEEAGLQELSLSIDGEEQSRGPVGFSIEPGAFTGKRLATSVTSVLTGYGKPLTLDQILDYLKAGSFDTKSVGGDKKVKEGIQKNTTTYTLLPHSDGLYGLKSWYESGKKGKKRAGPTDEETEPEADTEGQENGSVEEAKATTEESVAT